MALRALQGPTGGGSPVGGTGTTNTIPRWTGASTLGDSGITDNGSTVSFVGRNITAPATAGGASYVLAPTSGQVFGQTVGSSVWYLGRTTAAGAAVQPDICVNASGNVAIGTATPATANSRLTVAGGFIVPAAGFGVYQAGDHLTLSGGAGKNVHLKPNDGGVLAVNVGATSCDMSAVAGYGLKLPATPGNADTQTLDAYQENTWTPTLTAFDGTAPTTTVAKYTRIGRMVYFEIVLNATGGANFGATWGATKVSLPFTPANTIAIPINRNSISSCGATSGSDILLTTYAQSAETIRITGFFSV